MNQCEDFLGKVPLILQLCIASIAHSELPESEVLFD